LVEEYEMGKLVNRQLTGKQSQGSDSCDQAKSSHGSSISFREFTDNCQLLMADSPYPHLWTLKQVLLFLNHINLNKYAPVFTKYQIDGKKLMSLTEDDMSDLGIVVKGHRMTMRENVLKLQKLAYLYIDRLTTARDMLKTTQHENLPTTEDRLRSYFSQVDTIEEVEEGEAGSSLRSITNTVKETTHRANSWHSLSRPGRVYSLTRLSPLHEPLLPNCHLLMPPDRSLKLRANSAIETEIEKEYATERRAWDDSKRKPSQSQPLTLNRLIDIEEIDDFNPDQNEEELHELISHVAQPSTSSEVALPQPGARQ